jgi:phospholipid/cholesterol/gamma-HCH transport system ATP-binding protein
VLLKHLTGLMAPTSGSIKVNGVEIAGMGERQLAPIRKTMGILFQDGALFDSFTVKENVAFPLHEQGLKDNGEVSRRVAEALAAVGLEGHGHKLPGELSGGMRKRAGLARAIITNPECIFYDEPTSGLDPILADSIDHLILRLQERFKSTALVVTHDMKSMSTVAHRVAFLRDGIVYFIGTPQDFKASPDPKIQAFVQGISGERDL